MHTYYYVIHRVWEAQTIPITRNRGILCESRGKVKVFHKICEIPAQSGELRKNIAHLCHFLRLLSLMCHHGEYIFIWFDFVASFCRKRLLCSKAGCFASVAAAAEWQETK